MITTPKTKKSNRMIKMPKFLCEEMQEYLQMLYGLKKKRIVEQMAESEGITEQLKATDQVAWVGEMNNIWSRAREVVNAELIYN